MVLRPLNRCQTLLRRTCLSLRQQLGTVLGSERLRFFHKLLLLFFVELGWGCGPRGHWNSDLFEKLFLPGGRADAQQTRGTGGDVVKSVWRVDRDVDRVACAHNRLLSSKRGFHFTFEKNESLLEVMTMRGRAAAGRNVHIDHG